MKTFSAMILACLALSARAEGLSTFEGAGLLDAYIKVCAEVAPDKAAFYKHQILAGMSCGKPVAVTEKELADIRDSKNPQIRSAYQAAYQKAREPMDRATPKQKLEFCASFADVKC
jgi:hypothetical protein